MTSEDIRTVPYVPDGDANVMGRGVKVQSPHDIPLPTSVIINDDPSGIVSSEGVKTTCIDTNGSPATTLLREIVGMLDPHIMAGNVPSLVLTKTRALLSMTKAETLLVPLNKNALSNGFIAFDTVNCTRLSARKLPAFNDTSSCLTSERLRDPEALAGDKNVSDDDCVRDMPMPLRSILTLLFKGSGSEDVKMIYKVTRVALDIVVLGCIFNDIEDRIRG
jgi:hypothetical protein